MSHCQKRSRSTSTSNRSFLKTASSATAPIQTNGRTEPVDPKPNLSAEPEDPDSLDRPWRSPTTPLSVPVKKRIRKNGVPEPKYGKAFFICLIMSVLTTFLDFACQVSLTSISVGASAAFALSQLVTVVVGSLILILLVKIGLPTTFRRAGGVVGCFSLIGLVMATFLYASILLTPSRMRRG